MFTLDLTWSGYQAHFCGCFTLGLTLYQAVLLGLCEAGRKQSWITEATMGQLAGLFSESQFFIFHLQMCKLVASRTLLHLCILCLCL